jgi:hypothetical protein
MSVERARELQRMLVELNDRLATLPIRNLEIVAGGGAEVSFTVAGRVADEPTRQHVAAALAAAIAASGIAIESSIVLEASRTSGMAPSSFDGAPDASPARRAVRALLDRAGVLRVRCDYAEAVALCREAAQLAAGEPALLALAVYAHGYYQREGRAFIPEPHEPARPLLERARDLLGSPDADPILYERILSTLATCT